MKDLGNLSPTLGSNKDKKRLGRGPASGTGKTGGKGHKGQKARKGGGIMPGFEGGQTPLYRRLPKHGFTNARTKKYYEIVSLTDLNGFAAASAPIDKAALVEAGLIKKQSSLVKVLANGELKTKICLKVDKVSKSAKKAIEGLGGQIEEA